MGKCDLFYQSQQYRKASQAYARGAALCAVALSTGLFLLALVAPSLAQTTVPAPSVAPATPAPALPANKAKAKSKGPPPAATTASKPQPAQKAGGVGGLNIDLPATKPSSGGQTVTSAPGAFAASGPYASQALINQVTGKVKGPSLPKSPVSLGGAGSGDQNIGPQWAR